MTQNMPSSGQASPYDLSPEGVQQLVERLLALYAEQDSAQHSLRETIESLTEQVESLYAEKVDWANAIEDRNNTILSLVEQLKSIYSEVDEGI